MSLLGISTYPKLETIEVDKAYITLAAKYGIKKIFSCLISSVQEHSKEEVIMLYRELVTHAHGYGMVVFVDVSPLVFEKLGITLDDLSFFHKIGIDGIRLDESLDVQKEALLSFNPYGIKIELNASSGTRYLEYLLSYKANKANLTTCHNFYPQKYTGLSYNHFKKCSEAIKGLNLQVAAFVSSQVEGSGGPWKVNEGLCTLEMHRELPLDVQVRHLVATELVDEVIIANTYATKEEFKSINQVLSGKLGFKIDNEIEPSTVENQILYEHAHFVRGDMSDYMARSTMTRLTFAKESIVPRNTRDLKRGDVVILNDNYGRYKGEVHIILKDMFNEGNKNVIGSIPKNEQILMDFIEPWRVFEFIRK